MVLAAPAIAAGNRALNLSKNAEKMSELIETIVVPGAQY